VIDDVFENDLSVYEEKKIALEGTGSLVLDRVNRIMYCALSARADRALAEEFASKVVYRLVFFDTVKFHGAPVYHTDLMTHIGGQYQNVCSDFIAPDAKERVLKIMREHRAVYELSGEQFKAFCGNSQPAVNDKGQEFLSMSSNAYNAFGPKLREEIEKKHGVEFIHADIGTIERVGGGSGCCLALEGRHTAI
jgi:hypothetical protein